MSITVKSNAAAIQARLRGERVARTKRRAKQLQAIAKEKHRNAARDGPGINMFGEHRSAPGGPPAMETGALFAIIDQGLEQDGKTFRVPVNYAPLEFGFAVGARSRIADRKGLHANAVEPRPLGQQSVAELQQQVAAE